MRQLVGTVVLFALISCAAASDALDDDGPGTPSAFTMAEVTVEGTPEPSMDAIDLDARGKPLETTKVDLSAPFLDVRAIDVASDGRGWTMLEVRTAEGWSRLPDELLAYDEEDPGCPSIERESSIDEIRVEQGALVVVTSSDREVYDDGRAGTLVAKKARACRETSEGWTCSEPTVVEAKVALRSLDDESSEAVEKRYSSRYWVNADGEIETERPFDESVLTGAEPGT